MRDRDEDTWTPLLSDGKGVRGWWGEVEGLGRVGGGPQHPSSPPGPGYHRVIQLGFNITD
eukprot:580018-Hanusia_phi.AAC.1